MGGVGFSNNTSSTTNAPVMSENNMSEADRIHAPGLPIVPLSRLTVDRRPPLGRWPWACAAHSDSFFWGVWDSESES